MSERILRKPEVRKLNSGRENEVRRGHRPTVGKSRSRRSRRWVHRDVCRPAYQTVDPREHHRRKDRTGAEPDAA